MIRSIIKFLNFNNIEAWVGGGTARDLYLGLPPAGYDIMVKSDLETLRNILSDYTVKVDLYNTKIVVKFLDTFFNLYPLKRIKLINTYYNYEYTNSLEEDSKTKDFTCNALYYNPLTNEWFDFNNSMYDLDNHIIKFVGDPLTRILESKVRILRGLVLYARLGSSWRLDFDTADAIEQYKLKLLTVSPKIINEEFTKLFILAETPSLFFKKLKILEVLPDFFPELANCINVEQTNKAAGLDVFNHALLSLDAITTKNANVLILRLAALLHDIGKPYTKTNIDGNLHFYGHENVGAFLAEKLLYRYGFNINIISTVTNLIEHHLFDISKLHGVLAIKKLIHKVGKENIHILLDLRIADRLGTGKSDISMHRIDKLRDAINKVLATNKDYNLIRLNLSTNEISKITKYANVDFVINYLKTHVYLKGFANKKELLKQKVTYLLNKNCPLGTEHIFKVHTEHLKDESILSIDGTFKCGIFCNFRCNINNNQIT